MTTLDLDGEFAPVTRLHPGDFERHPHNGAPYVTHPTDTIRPQGNKSELREQCIAAGVELPQRITVDIMRDLLRRPKRVQYGRPSGLGKQIENTINLQKWSERMVALGIARDSTLQNEAAKLADLDQNGDEFKQAADALAVKAKQVAQAHLAAERGTHHHELTEDVDNDRDPIARMERGEQLGVPRHVQHALLDAWASMLTTFGLEILATEAPCVDDGWCQAGTLDRIARLTRDLRFVLPDGEIVTLPAGLIIVLDIKTGRLRVDEKTGLLAYWLSYAVQLASYAKSVPYNTATGCRGEWGFKIDQRWAVIAHLDILAALDGEAVCRLILVDLEAGRHAGDLCVDARKWEKRKDVFSVPCDDLAVRVPVNKPAETDINPSDGAASATRRQWLLGRIEVVKEHGYADELIAVWPQGVKGTATDHQHNDAELDLIHQAVDTIEKRHGLPLDPDPGAVARKVDAILDARRATPVASSTSSAPDEGVDLADAEFDALQQAIQGAPPENQQLVNTWLAEAIKANVGFSAARVRSTRRRAIIHAAFALANLCEGKTSETDLAVAALHLVTGTEHGTIGETLGRLTQPEAEAVLDLVGDVDRLALSYSTGRPRLVAQIAS